MNEILIILVLIVICLGICVIIAPRGEYRWLRIIAAAVLMCLATGFGYFVLLLVGVLSGSDFFIAFVAIVTVVIFFLIPLSVLGRLRKRRFIISWASFIGISVLTIAGAMAYQYYDDSFEIIYEDSFSSYDNLAKLDEPASFQIEGTLSMDGATALYPLYAAFAQAVYQNDPAWKGAVVSFTTPIAYERLINGEVDMIFVAAPSEKQKAAALGQGIELEFTPIGKEAFVFFVNTNNPLDGLSTEQIKDIYSGEITNWRELGGSNKAILAFQRDEGSGSQSAFLRFMADREPLPAPTKKVHDEMAGMVESVADYKNYPAAIGYSFRYFLQEMAANDRIKLLALDGVYPSAENMRNGSYPSGNFYAVVDKNNPNPNIQPMLEWILSEQGQAILEKTGYVAIPSSIASDASN